FLKQTATIFSGASTWFIDPTTMAGNSSATLSLFRNVNTTGARVIRVFRGDGTATEMANIHADTGAANFQDISGRTLTATVANGTPPLVVTSQTAVANLHASNTDAIQETSGPTRLPIGAI